MRARWTSPTFLAALALTASLTTACGNRSSAGSFQPNGSLAGSTPTTAPSTAGPAALPTAEVNKTVLARYTEFRKAFRQAYATNDPSPLAAVAMNPLLDTTTQEIEQFKARNEVWRFTTVSNARVYGRSRDGLTVYVVDCLRTLGAFRFSLTTGKRTASGQEQSFLHRTAVRYDQGTWKVSDTVQDKRC